LVKRRFGSRGYGEKSKGWRFLILGALAAALLWFGYQKFIQMNLSKANEAFAASDYDRAAKYFQRVSSLPLTKGRGLDGLGAVKLIQGEKQAATKHFQSVLTRKPGKWGGDPKMIIDTFLANGRYQAGEAYREFLLQWFPEKKLKPFFAGFASLALGARKPEIARTYLEMAPEDDPRFSMVTSQLEAIQRQGYIPMIADRNGNPIAIYNLDNQNAEYASQKLFVGWPALAGDEGLMAKWPEIDWESQVQTSIDINLQKAARQAMGNYLGTMIILEPRSGDVLAAYGTDGLDPFSTTFEPGSVIKVLTLGSILKENPDLTRYAPKKYPSSMTIGGKIFYDWTTQGQLKTVEEGMAVSCNLMFAQMGIDLGWPKLSSDLKRLFDRHLEPGLLPQWSSLGHVLRDPEGAYELGRFAIGLDMMQSTSLGISLIPSAIVNGGTLPHPRLILGHLNLEGDGVGRTETAKLGPIFKTEHLQMLTAAMVEAVNDERGTARRAKVDFVNAAIKTGTSGERPFDSVMIGFMPVENPKIAFGFFLKSGGKAEIHGGRVAKNLQEQIKALAPTYLD